MRQNDKDKVFAVINFSGQPQAVTFQESLHHGRYADYFGGNSVELGDSTRLRLEPWGYRVFVRRPPVTLPTSHLRRAQP